jgi:hypothetical protein
MNHEEAKKLMAAEAYILDDLEPAERGAFEEHFFDCTDCTADVLDAANIADGLRTGSNVVPIRPYQSRWAVAAAAAVVAILAYYIPHLTRHSGSVRRQAPIAITAAQQTLDLDAARAAQTPYVIVGNQSVSVGFVIPVTDPRPPYVCELRDGAGVLIGSTKVDTKEEASNPVSLVIPAGKFHSGQYKLGIRGGDREIPPYHFAVEVQ